MRKLLKFVILLFNILTSRSKFAIVIRDFFLKLDPIESDDLHLEATFDWLKISQKISKNGGSSGMYSFLKGWKDPYPETTGYLIPTLIEYYKLTKNTEFIDMAFKLADWEIEIQLDSGAVRGGVGINDYPIVFNTGQVIIGWMALYNYSKVEKYLESAERACVWLVSNMDEDGKWSKNTYNNIPHAYNVRVTWALLDVGINKGSEDFKNAAIKNILWVLSNCKENGWINHMGFTKEDDPYTHTIAYTLRGLLECSFLLSGELKQKILRQVSLAASEIMKLYNERQIHMVGIKSMLPGTLNKNWEPSANYSCLTGNAQISIIWLKLYQISGDKEYLDSAIKIIDQIKSTQKLNCRNKGIRGGIAGSYPIWGGYIHYAYPNWAAKFFADALILKKKILMDTI